MGIITFNGISSDSLGIVVERPPQYEVPERDYEEVTVPGRNGPVLIDKGAFKNIDRTYDIAKGSEWSGDGLFNMLGSGKIAGDHVGPIVGDAGISNDGWVTMVSSGTGWIEGNLLLASRPQFKPSTNYTIVTDIITNTITSGANVFITSANSATVWAEDLKIPRGFVGRFIGVAKTKANLSGAFKSLCYIIQNNALQGEKITLRSYILEGEYLDKERSVTNLADTGKNPTWTYRGVNEWSDTSSFTTRPGSSVQEYIIKKGVTYTIIADVNKWVNGLTIGIHGWNETINLPTRLEPHTIMFTTTKPIGSTASGQSVNIAWYGAPESVRDFKISNVMILEGDLRYQTTPVCVQNVVLSMDKSMPYTFTANGTQQIILAKTMLKPNTDYTVTAYVYNNTINDRVSLIGWNTTSDNNSIPIIKTDVGRVKIKFRTNSSYTMANAIELWKENTTGSITITDYMILEGDWTNREIPKYFFEGVYFGEGSLRALPNGVSDKIVTSGYKKYVKRYVGKYTIEPEKVSTIVTNSLGGGYMIAINDFIADVPNNYEVVGVCDSLMTVNANYIWGNNVLGCISVNTHNQIHMRISGVTTVAEAKTYFTNNPTTFYYPLANPYLEEMKNPPSYVQTSSFVPTIQLPQYFDGTYSHFERLSNMMATWLYSGYGYLRLEDSYEPNFYKLARFSGPTNVANILQQAGRVSITFDRKPQRFLKSGDTTVTYNVSGTIVNPTGFPAKPLIVISGSGAGTLTIGEYTVAISNMSTPITVECEVEDAFNDAANLNALVTCAKGFPILKAGSNQVKIEGGITSVQITPRWWTI